jgi:hypothetical protein
MDVADSAFVGDLETIEAKGTAMYSVLMQPDDGSPIERFPNMTPLEACLLPSSRTARFVIVGNHPMRRRVITRGELVVHLLLMPDTNCGPDWA